MDTLEFTVIDPDFPVGSKSKTATGAPPRSSTPARSSPPASPPA
ncbi:hypothetical protein [Streptomyces sp. NPDC050704]